MGAVVRLKLPRRPMAATFTRSFEEAWKAYPSVGRARSSRQLAAPEWAKASADVAEEDLLRAVRRYAAEDKDQAQWGSPGFHRWLAQGRYDHWLVTPEVVEAPKFSDLQMRAMFFAKFTDDRAQRWFDRCGWNAATREISAPWRPRQEWLEGPFNRWMGVVDIRAVVFGEMKPVHNGVRTP